MAERELTSELRHRRQNRKAATTIFVVLLMLFFAFWYAYSYYRTSAGAGDATPTTGATCRPFDPKVPTPATTTVNVYNASTKNGLAARTAAELRKRGFLIGEVRNDPLRRKVAVAEVRFGPAGKSRAPLRRPPRRQGHDVDGRQAQGRVAGPRAGRVLLDLGPVTHGDRAADVPLAEHQPLEVVDVTVAPGAPMAPIVLSPDLTATEALDVIVRAAGEHITQHVALLRSEGDPEALHQVRIGIRRARVAFSLLSRPLGDGEKLAWVSTEIRDLAVPLGRARDLDVTVRDYAEYLTGSSRRRLAKRQAAAYTEVLEVVGSDRWSDLRTHVDVLLRHLHDEVALDPPVLDASRDALDRRLRRVLRRGADLRRASPSERHTVRKEAKKLRYGVQFFGSLYAVPPESANESGSAPYEFAAKVADLQDALGELGDLETSRHLLELVGATPPEVHRGPIVKRATAALADLGELDPFWRAPAR